MLPADLQIDFWRRLGELRHDHLAPALSETTAALGIYALDDELAERESPTTTQFLDLEQIADVGSDEHAEFRDVLAAKVGIRVGPGGA